MIIEEFRFDARHFVELRRILEHFAREWVDVLLIADRDGTNGDRWSKVYSGRPACLFILTSRGGSLIPSAGGLDLHEPLDGSRIDGQARA